ncbi:MerR family transcriptional regulator [Micromonospora sp. RTGN7]|uniref:MerR family transcriptional regulator n=1 Tax=Micromonospora sp. RTGN7 TaxID=3016526 RepID=UPI0029FF1966|nr:MerR family transcriptional regulator [Micromonospora sp. RTGN7]
MRIAELSSRSGVPVPTIKYYLREGLLPSGEVTSPNQARYADSHVFRLRLVRVLLDAGGLSIAEIGRLLAELDRPDPDVPAALSETVRPGPSAPPPADPRIRAAAATTVGELIGRRGWDVDPENPAWRAATDLVVALRQVGLDADVDALDAYARAAEGSVEADRRLAPIANRHAGSACHHAVAAILGDGLLAALRRLADQGRTRAC